MLVYAVEYGEESCQKPLNNQKNKQESSYFDLIHCKINVTSDLQSKQNYYGKDENLVLIKQKSEEPYLNAEELDCEKFFPLHKDGT